MKNRVSEEVRRDFDHEVMSACAASIDNDMIFVRYSMCRNVDPTMLRMARKAADKADAEFCAAAHYMALALYGDEGEREVDRRALQIRDKARGRVYARRCWQAATESDESEREYLVKALCEAFHKSREEVLTDVEATDTARFPE